jgi:hypothetical protein
MEGRKAHRSIIRAAGDRLRPPTNTAHSVIASERSERRKKAMILGALSADEGSGFRVNQGLSDLSLTLTLSRRERGPILSDLQKRNDWASFRRDQERDITRLRRGDALPPLPAGEGWGEGSNVTHTGASKARGYAPRFLPH